MGKTKINVVGDTPAKKLEPKKSESKKVHLSGLKGGQRVKMVEADTQAEVQNVQEVQKLQKTKPEHRRGKKYLTARAKIDPKKTYSVSDAAKLVKETSISKFTGSVELHLVLAKDSVNTRIELPYSSGKSKKVEIASDETIQKLQKGKIDFDVLLASPAMMPKLVPYAKLLGPKGLMPNPKNGTLAPDPEKAKEQFGANTLNIKTEKSAPLIHTVVAKTNQPESEIEENIQTVIKSVGGQNIKKAVVSPSMGPGINLAF